MRGFRSLGRLFGVVLSVSMVFYGPLGQCAAAWAAEATPAATTTTQAAAPSAPIEIVERRTETSKTFKLSDGTVRTQLYPAPIHVKDATGSWVAIDPNFVADVEPGAYTAAATPVEVTVRPDSTTTSAVSLADDGWRVDIDPVARPSAPVVVGDTAVFPAVATGASLRYEPLRDGVKETIVLDSREATGSYTFHMDTQGLELRAYGAGWALFAPGGTTPELYLGGVWAADSATGTPAVCEGATMTVTPDSAGGALVTYSVPRAWLDDPARVFPVYIDPSLTSSVDAYVNGQEPGVAHNNTELVVGTNSAGTEVKDKSYAKFDLSTLGTNAYVHAATYSAYIKQHDAASSLAYLGQVNTGWTEGVTYNTRPSVSALNSVSVAGTNKRVYWPTITSVAQGWVDSPGANAGVSMYQQDTDTVYCFKRFYSKDQSNGNVMPRLDVDGDVPVHAVEDVTGVVAADDSQEVTATFKLNTAYPDDARVLELGLKDATGALRGQFGWFAYDPGAGWTTSAAPGGGYFAVADAASASVTPLFSRWSTARVSGTYRRLSVVFKIKNTYGDTGGASHFSTYAAMGPATTNTWWSGWKEHTAATQTVTVRPAVLSSTDVTATTSPLGWWRSTAATGNDLPGVGRGVVDLTWSSKAGATASSYKIMAHDGNGWQQVGWVPGTVRSWSSRGAGIYPTDSEIASMPADTTQNPYTWAASPRAAAQLSSMNLSAASYPASDTGITLTDGRWLYVRPWGGATDSVTSQWMKVGTGLRGTVAGSVAATVGPPLRPALSGFYLDGALYAGRAVTPTSLAGVWTGSSSSDTATVSLSLPAPLLDKTNGAAIGTSFPGRMLVASDGRRIFSVADNEASGYGGWTVRVFSRPDTATATWVHERDFAVAGPSYYTAGVLTDGTSLFLIEYGGADPQVTKVRISDGAVINRWSLVYGTTPLINGSYDAANDCFWLGQQDVGGTPNRSIGRYRGSGLDLRDNPNALYRTTAGTTLDAATDYRFAVMPVNSAGPTTPVGDNARPALDNRTVVTAAEPAHTTAEAGQIAGHQAQAVLDTGELSVSVTDLEAAGYGPTTALSRTYSSGDTSATRFAAGWVFSFDERIESVNATTVAHIDASGESRRYRLTADGTYQAPPGAYATLSRRGDGGWVLTERSGAHRDFGPDGLITHDYDDQGLAVVYERGVPGEITIKGANDSDTDQHRIVVTLEPGTGRVLSARYTRGTAWRQVSYDTTAATATWTTSDQSPDDHAVSYGYTAGRLSTISVGAPGGPALQTWTASYAGGQLSGFAGVGVSAAEAAHLTYSASGAARVARLERTGDVDGAPTTIAETFTINPTGTQASRTTPAVAGQTPGTYSYTYSPGNEPTTERTPLGHVTTSLIDQYGQTTDTYDEDEHHTAYVFDDRGNTIREVSPRGATTYRAYDEHNNLVTEERVVDAAGTRTHAAYAYDAQGRQTQKTELVDAQVPTSTVTVYSYAGSAAPYAEPGATTINNVALGGGGPVVDVTTSVTFGPFGEQVGSVDASGHVSSASTVTVSGLTVQSAGADGVVTTTTYDVLGRAVATVRSAAGQQADRTATAYDDDARTVTQTTYAQGDQIASVSTRRTDALGRETTVTDPKNGTATNHYDAAGNVVAAWAAGVSTASAIAAERTRYDSMGNVTFSVSAGAPDASGTATSYYPDGSQNTVTEPDGTSTQSFYDEDGNKTREEATDAGVQAVTTYVTDLGGRTTATTNADGATTKTTYDLLGRALGVSAGGPASTTTYNAAGWVVAATDSELSTTTTRYDVCGRSIDESKTTAGVITHETKAYDSAGRVVAATEADGKLTTTAYDVFGRVSRVIRSAGGTTTSDVTTTYDVASRPVSGIDDVRGIGHTFEYTSGAVGGAVGTETVAYGQTTATIVYDAAGRTATRTVEASGAPTSTLTASYDQATGRQLGSSWASAGGSLGSTATYDPATGRLTSRSVGARTLSQTYPAGSARVSRESATGLLGGTIDTTYAYNDAGRLVGAKASGVATTTYGYTAAGDITTIGPVAAAYDGSGRIRSLGSTTFGFDAAGRRTSRISPSRATTYTYTAGDRLSGWTEPTTTASFTYDATGQRTRSIITGSAGTTTTDYTYEGLSLLSLRAVSTAGTGTATDTVEYAYDGAGRPYQGAWRSSGGSSVLFGIVANQRGDVLELVDAAGIAFASYRYDAFGNPTALVSVATTGASGVTAADAARIAAVQPLRFSGYYYDAASGLYYCSQRYYDPATAQFITRDPAKADGETSAYQYCGGDPVSRIDRSGLHWVKQVSASKWREPDGMNIYRTYNIPDGPLPPWASLVNLVAGMVLDYGSRVKWRSSAARFINSHTGKSYVKVVVDYYLLQPTSGVFSGTAAFINGLQFRPVFYIPGLRRSSPGAVQGLPSTFEWLNWPTFRTLVWRSPVYSKANRISYVRVDTSVQVPDLTGVEGIGHGKDTDDHHW